ncbi:MAG: DUF3073 domain-containing protein [Nocardioidaceae bacterium]|nr:DUF3073 domain-containing protein [Nocardioidaceae bacterium]
MGRGRAKAKQTKVARELKYRNYDTDFSELQRELQGDGHVPPGGDADTSGEEVAADVDDPYAGVYDDDSEAVNQR